MRQTINQIYTELITEKETFTSLSGLTSPTVPDTSQLMLTELQSNSKVAVWRLMYWVVAVVSFTLQSLMDVFKTEVSTIAQNAVTGTLRWYVVIAKAFQNGYDLTWTDKLKWEYTDTTSVAAVASKIVTQASATESNSELILKCAKGAIGSLEPLSTAELASFTSYIDDIKFAGTVTTVINETGQTLDYSMTVTYDPLVLTSDGILIRDGASVPVTSAVIEYIQTIPFDSEFSVMSMVDAAQAAEGVKNVVCSAASIVFPNVNILTATSTQTYTPRSGYMVPGTATITYTT